MNWGFNPNHPPPKQIQTLASPQCQLARPTRPSYGKLQCEQPTRSTETKSKQRNDIDDRYLILETTGTW